MIPALLAEIGIPLLARLLREGLERIDHPVAEAAAEGLAAVEGAIGSGDIEAAKLAEANRHLETMAAISSDDYRTALAQVNESLRAEIASDDPYVRRMRPTFGYILAATWAAQVGAVAWAIIADPPAAARVIADMANLSVIWSVGLGVLGVYVYQRSREKIGRPSRLSPAAFGDMVLNLARERG